MTVFEFLLKLAEFNENLIPPLKMPTAPGPKPPKMTSPEGIKTDNYIEPTNFSPTNLNVSKKYQIT